MKNIKIIGLLTLLCTISLSCNFSNNNDEYPTHSTDKFIYTISKTEEFMQFNEAQLTYYSNYPIYTSTISQNHYFNTGITRTKISKNYEIENNKIIIITETWITKNPSYLTWTNTALMIYIMYKIFNYPLSVTLDKLNPEDLQNMTELEKRIRRAAQKASQGENSTIEWFIPSYQTKQNCEDISNAIQRYADKADIKINGNYPPTNFFKDDYCINMQKFDSDIKQSYIKISVESRTMSNIFNAWLYGKK